MTDYNKLVQMDLEESEIRIIDNIIEILKEKRLYNIAGQFVRWETEREAYLRSKKEIKQLRNQKPALFLEAAK